MRKKAILKHARARELGLVDIGRAAKETGVSVKMIRHYEAIGLVPKVARTAANYRMYGSSDIHTLRFIRRARALGFAMADIKELVSLLQSRWHSGASAKRIASRHLGALKSKVADAQAMLETLEHLSRQRHGETRSDVGNSRQLKKSSSRSSRHGC